MEGSRPVCPRCGGLVDWFERRVVRSGSGVRVYVYAVHKAGGRVRKCYLGPEDSYVYVSKTHSGDGLVFFGSLRRDRLKLYLSSIIQAISSADLSEDDLRDILFALKDAVRAIEEKLREKREERNQAQSEQREK